MLTLFEKFDKRLIKVAHDSDWYWLFVEFQFSYHFPLNDTWIASTYWNNILSVRRKCQILHRVVTPICMAKDLWLNKGDILLHYITKTHKPHARSVHSTTNWYRVHAISQTRPIICFLCVSFWLHGFCGKWEGLDPVNRFYHTDWVAIVTSTGRPKSVRNRCVIEVFRWRFCVVTLLFGFLVGVGAFVIWLSQISSFFSRESYVLHLCKL